LVLVDGIDWFFTEGAQINSAGTMFSDSGNTIRTIISGHGIFTTSGTFMNLTGNSNVSVSTDNIIATGTGNIFDVTDVDYLILNANTLTVDTGRILTIGGNANMITFNASIVTGNSNLMTVDPTSTGWFTGDFDNVTGGAIDTDIFNIESNDYYFNLDIIRLNMITGTAHAIRLVDNAAALSSSLRSQISINTIIGSGGVLFVNGIAGLNDPVIEPRVSFNSSLIILTDLGLVSVFDVEACIVVINIDTMSYTYTNSTSYVMTSRLVTVSHLTFQQCYDSSDNTVAGANFIQALPGSRISVDGNELFNQGTTLNVGTTAVVNVNINTVGSLLTDVPAIISSGNTQLNIYRFEINSLASTGFNIIETTDDLFISDINILSYDIEDSVLFSINGGTYSSITSNLISSGANTSTMIAATDANLSVSVGQIFGNGTDNNGIILNGLSQCNVDIQRLVINNIGGSGIQILDNSSMSGSIEDLFTNTGPSIIHISDGNLDLIYNKIATNTGIACMTFTGDGDTQLSGNTINTRDCTDGIIAGGGGVSGAAVSIRCNNFFQNSGSTAITVDAPNGNLYFNSMDIRTGQGGDNTIASFHIVSGVASISSDNVIMRNTSSTPGILVSEESSFRGYFGNVLSDGSVLDITSNNFIEYFAKTSVVDDSLPVINITSNGGNITVGGYMTTGADDCILINGPNIPGTFRVTNATMVSAVSSINSINPLTVITNPSIANRSVTGPVTIVPVGTLSVDFSVA
jgi:hypothetical protein